MNKVNNSDADSKLQFFLGSHSHLAQLIRFADVKSAMIMGWTSAMFGGLSTCKSHSHFTCTKFALCDIDWWITYLAITSVCAFSFLAVAFLLAVAAFYPRRTGVPEKGFLFWESILAHQSSKDFVSEAVASTVSTRIEHLLFHHFTIARICEIKYRYVSASVLCGLIGSILASIVILSA